MYDTLSEGKIKRNSNNQLFNKYTPTKGKPYYVLLVCIFLTLKTEYMLVPANGSRATSDTYHSGGRSKAAREDGCMHHSTLYYESTSEQMLTWSRLEKADTLLCSTWY